MAKKLLEVCCGPNCQSFTEAINERLREICRAGIGEENSSFKITKTICSKNCGNRFGPPVIRINGKIIQGEVLLRNLRDIVFSPQKFHLLFGKKIYLDGDFSEVEGDEIGLAIDIGTTNVKIAFVDLTAGKTVALASSLNGQAAYGPTVVDRVHYFLKQRNIQKEDGVRIMQKAAIRTINEMIRKIIKEYNRRHNGSPINFRAIRKICAAGNTVMSYLFLGQDPEIYKEGDKPQYRKPKIILAREIGILAERSAEVYIFPSVSEYIGGDIVSGIFAKDFFPADKNRLFIDLGTNGEIVLILKDPSLIAAASASAGPAFEGGGLKYGGYTAPGSITSIYFERGRLKYQTFKRIKPVNLCGSGALELLYELFRNKVVDKIGNIDPASVLARPNSRGETGLEILAAEAGDTGIGEDITITQNEIKYFIDSKAAIFAAIAAILELMERKIDEIEEINIAGGFGNLDFKKAVAIGLLPNAVLGRFQYAGNTSLAGTIKFLLDHDSRRVEDIVSAITTFDFSRDIEGQKLFFEHYIKARFVPQIF